MKPTPPTLKDALHAAAMAQDANARLRATVKRLAERVRKLEKRPAVATVYRNSSYNP